MYIWFYFNLHLEPWRLYSLCEKSSESTEVKKNSQSMRKNTHDDLIKIRRRKIKGRR